jgi:uncharacterized membrane protein
MSKSKSKIGFLKTTAIGGLFFLLPLIVLGALVGQIAPIIWTIATGLHQILPFKTPAGIAFLFLLAVAIIVLLCFAAGLLARRSIGKRLSEGFEKKLILLFPRYAILKEQMAGSIGGREIKPNWKPVAVKFYDSVGIGFQVETIDAGQVMVYLPGAPDTWSGKLAVVQSDRVKKLDLDFGQTISIFEKIGRDSNELLGGKLNEIAMQ